jgi:hypothetical protein
LIGHKVMTLADRMETGELGIYQLKRLWSRTMVARQGTAPVNSETQLDHLLLHAVGLGLEQATQYLMQTAPTFAEFERWIINTTGGVPPVQVARINAVVCGEPAPAETRRWLDAVDASQPVLSPEDLAFWDEQGYVVLHDAVSEASRDAAAQATLDFLGVHADDPDTWYPPNPNGIMVQLFQHPALDANRRSPRLHKAFAQLWGNTDLWVSTDRVGFNAPERADKRFRGPDLHWDVSLQLPIPFGTQGILYLTDTEPEQGALTLVPGFHKRVGAWLDGLPADTNARQQDLHSLGSQPIGGRAGDLIIWHQALPHGSRPNRAQRPRIVQYINMRPAYVEERDVWK